MHASIVSSTYHRVSPGVHFGVSVRKTDTAKPALHVGVGSPLSVIRALNHDSGGKQSEMAVVGHTKSGNARIAVNRLEQHVRGGRPGDAYVLRLSKKFNEARGAHGTGDDRPFIFEFGSDTFSILGPGLSALSMVVPPSSVEESEAVLRGLLANAHARGAQRLYLEGFNTVGELQVTTTTEVERSAGARSAIDEILGVLAKYDKGVTKELGLSDLAALREPSIDVTTTEHLAESVIAIQLLSLMMEPSFQTPAEVVLLSPSMMQGRYYQTRMRHIVQAVLDFISGHPGNSLGVVGSKTHPSNFDRAVVLDSSDVDGREIGVRVWAKLLKTDYGRNQAPDGMYEYLVGTV